MLNIEQIRERLSDRNLSEVARRLKITRPYLSAIKNGRVTPSYKLVEKLSDYIEGKLTEAGE